MVINKASGLKRRSVISRLKLAGWIALRNGVIGLISGGVLGALFGGLWLTFSVPVGAGLGLTLGLVNGLLLSLITGLFFYPLRAVRLYQAIVKLISVTIAGGGAAIFGPWYFSSTSMTPSSAVFIGFSSVLASIIAGLAGGLAGQNTAAWYEQESSGDHSGETASRLSGRTSFLYLFTQFLDGLFAERQSWGSVGLLALFCMVFGNALLGFLVCGNQEAFECLPSPRLYNSVLLGFKAVLPICFFVLLIVLVVQSKHKRPG